MGRAQADEASIHDAHHCAALAKEAVETRLIEEKVIYSLAGGAVLSLNTQSLFSSGR